MVCSIIYNPIIFSVEMVLCYFCEGLVIPFLLLSLYLNTLVFFSFAFQNGGRPRALWPISLFRRHWIPNRGKLHRILQAQRAMFHENNTVWRQQTLPKQFCLKQCVELIKFSSFTHQMHNKTAVQHFVFLFLFYIYTNTYSNHSSYSSQCFCPPVVK